MEAYLIGKDQHLSGPDGSYIAKVCHSDYTARVVSGIRGAWIKEVEHGYA